MSTIPKELQALAPELNFCDKGHPGVSFAIEDCPVCTRTDEVNYLNTRIDEMRIELEDLKEKAKLHRII
jgi:hypothetical protein